MKFNKVFLTLSLIVCLAFGGFALAACKKDNGYKISSLRLDYVACFDNSDSFAFVYDTQTKTNKITNKVYSSSSVELKSILATAPYNVLDNYVELLNYSTNFLNYYTDDCSEDANGVDKDLRNEVKSLLDKFSSSLDSIDLLLRNFQDNLMLTLKDPQYSQNKELAYSSVHLNSFKRLLDAYNETFDVSYELSIALSKVYYTYVYRNNNMNYFATPFGSGFDPINVLHGLESRFRYEIAMLAYKYYQENIKYSNLTETIITKQDTSYGSMGSNYSNLKTQVQKLDKTVLLSAASYTNTEEFYKCAVSLYNIQTCLNNDFERYEKASKEIDYAKVKTLANKSKRELMCVEIIESYYHLIDQNYSALARIAALI